MKEKLQIKVTKRNLTKELAENSMRCGNCGQCGGGGGNCGGQCGGGKCGGGKVTPALHHKR